MVFLEGRDVTFTMAASISLGVVSVLPGSSGPLFRIQVLYRVQEVFSVFGRSSQPDSARPAETPAATPSQSGFIAPNNEPPAAAPKPALGMRSGTMTTGEVATSVIGKDLHIGGEKIIIVCESRLQVDGEIVGDLAGREVIIGQTASVTGSVAAERVEVLGKVDGAIKGRQCRVAAVRQGRRRHRP